MSHPQGNSSISTSILHQLQNYTDLALWREINFCKESLSVISLCAQLIQEILNGIWAAVGAATAGRKSIILSILNYFSLTHLLPNFLSLLSNTILTKSSQMSVFPSLFMKYKKTKSMIPYRNLKLYYFPYKRLELQFILSEARNT